MQPLKTPSSEMKAGENHYWITTLSLLITTVNCEIEQNIWKLRRYEEILYLKRKSIWGNLQWNQTSINKYVWLLSKILFHTQMSKVHLFPENFHGGKSTLRPSPILTFVLGSAVSVLNAELSWSLWSVT